MGSIRDVSSKVSQGWNGIQLTRRKQSHEIRTGPSLEIIRTGLVRFMPNDTTNFEAGPVFVLSEFQVPIIEKKIYLIATG